MVQSVFDRRDTAVRKTTAATEWRTIPPTIKVRHKKRPPPLTIYSKRSYEQLVRSPGPLDTGTTASSSSLPSFSSASSEPPSAFARHHPFIVGLDPRAGFYATPEFQHSPDTEIDEIPLPSWLAKKPESLESDAALEAVVELETESEEAAESIPIVPPPPPGPDDPLQYLTDNPWTLPEYFQLLSLAPEGDHDWERIASALNAASPPTAPQRTPWDCWHRWAVPWSARAAPPPDAQTFAHAVGVQHPCQFVDMTSLIDTFALVSRALPSPTLSLPPDDADAPPPPPSVRARHPDYPPVTSRPNVPPRTYGHRDWGMSSWFHMCAVNVATLRRLLYPPSDPSTSARPLVPRHLQDLKLAPPPRPGDRASVSR
ncbi:hypothetical protein FA95DRAFT_1575365 [Auriscalpium vulgare]|uniref:Uncharacterized protein n=1 Tax=Auriscalpium vulgare TaxID=40419 RepID=A0ACB8RGA5_9AGAM|nr:hypothetical protein FA95DRAFT_1575365 [Auriscalpium vulgare]